MNVVPVRPAVSSYAPVVACGSCGDGVCRAKVTDDLTHNSTPSQKKEEDIMLEACVRSPHTYSDSQQSSELKGSTVTLAKLGSDHESSTAVSTTETESSMLKFEESKEGQGSIPTVSTVTTLTSSALIGTPSNVKNKADSTRQDIIEPNRFNRRHGKIRKNALVRCPSCALPKPWRNFRNKREGTLKCTACTNRKAREKKLRVRKIVLPNFKINKLSNTKDNKDVYLNKHYVLSTQLSKKTEAELEAINALVSIV